MRRRTFFALLAATATGGCQRARDAIPLGGTDEAPATDTPAATTTVGYGGTTSTAAAATTATDDGTATTYGAVGYGEAGYGGVPLEDA
ncbi:hypothetical protein VB779_06215 [Haloarculaceae archaeon H-GB11]|nr:hypothetical protein [Haloarculaceae archaeon H-GB1-1]MEA5386702.1 hypothetical protein [Haloarculaceae archaeon H-GB11]